MSVMLQLRNKKANFSKTILLLLFTSTSFSLSYGANPTPDIDPHANQTGVINVAIPDDLWSGEVSLLTWTQRLENFSAQQTRAAQPHQNILQTERFRRIATALGVTEGADTVQDRAEIDLQVGVVNTLYHLLDLLNPNRYVYDSIRVQNVQTSLISQLFRLGRFRYEIAAEYVELARRFAVTPERDIPEREGPLEVSTSTVAPLPDNAREPAKKWLDYIINHYHLRNNSDISQIFNKLLNLAQRNLDQEQEKIVDFLSEPHLMQLEYLRTQRLGVPVSMEFCLPYLLPFQNLSSTMPYAVPLKEFVNEGWLTNVITPGDFPQIERFYQQFSSGLEYQRIGEFIRTVLSPLEDIASVPLGRDLTDQGRAFIHNRLGLMGAATVFDRIPKTLFQREASELPECNVDLLRRFIPFTQLRNIALLLHNANQLERPRDRGLINGMLNQLVPALRDLLPYMRKLVKDEVLLVSSRQQPLRFILEDERQRYENTLTRIKKVGQFGSDIAIFSKLRTTLDNALLNKFRTPLANWSPRVKKAFVRIFMMLGESSKNLSNRAKLLVGSDNFWTNLSDIRDGIIHPSASSGAFSRERLETFLDNADAVNNILLQNVLGELEIVLNRMKNLYDSEYFTIDDTPNIEELPDVFGNHVQGFFDQVRNLAIPPSGIPVRDLELLDITELTFEPKINADAAVLDDMFNLMHYQTQLVRLQELVNAHDFVEEFDNLVNIIPFSDGKKQEIRVAKIRYQNLSALIADANSFLQDEPLTEGFTQINRKALVDFLIPTGELVENEVTVLKIIIDNLPDLEMPGGDDDDENPFAAMGVSTPHPLIGKFEEFIKNKKAFKADLEKCMALDLKQSYEEFRSELLVSKSIRQSLEDAVKVDFIEESVKKESDVRKSIQQQLKRFGIQQNKHVDCWFSNLKKHYGLLLNSFNQRKRGLQKLFNSTLRLERTLEELRRTTAGSRKGNSVEDIRQYWDDPVFCLALEDDFEGLRHRVGGLSSNLDILHEIHPAIASVLQFHLENLRRLGNDLGHLGDVHGFSTLNEKGKSYYLRRTLKILMGEMSKESISLIEALKILRIDLNQAIVSNDNASGVPSASPTLNNGDTLECIPVGVEPPRKFTLKWVAKDGNCGFTSLGISRSNAVTQLLAHSSDAAIREAVGEDIRQALLQGHLPIRMTTPATNELRATYFHVQNQIDTLRRELGNIAPNITIEELEAEALLIQNANPQRFGLLRQFAQVINNQTELETRIRDYIHRQDVYKQFIQEEFCRGAWLGYVRGGRGTLYALACINNLNVHIWHQNSTGQLEEIPLAPGLIGEERHLLHTDGLTHFHSLRV